MPKPKPKAKVTIAFDCNHSHFERAKTIGMLELVNLVMKALDEKRVTITVEEIKDA